MTSKAAVSLFEHYLIVRIIERIQDICITECSGCKNNYRFASLHPCQKLSLSERVDMFLPQVLSEALDNMEKLVALFPAYLNFPTTGYEELGAEFVKQLTATNMFDRRYINEGTESLFEFDNRWFTPEALEPTYQEIHEELQRVCDNLVEEEEEEGIQMQIYPKIVKRKAHSNARNEDDIERISDQPVKKARKLQKPRAKK